MAEKIKLELVVRLRGDAADGHERPILRTVTRSVERSVRPYVGETYSVLEKIELRVTDITHPYKDSDPIRVGFNVFNEERMFQFTATKGWKR